jgi:hypothetical protein
MRLDPPTPKPTNPLKIISHSKLGENPLNKPPKLITAQDSKKTTLLPR